MPTYQFRSKDTQEIFELVMKMRELDQYLADNPNVERFHDEAPPIGDPVRLGIRRIDNGFKEVLQKIKSKHYKSTIDTR